MNISDMRVRVQQGVAMLPLADGCAIAVSAGDEFAAPSERAQRWQQAGLVEFRPPVGVIE